VGFAVDFHVGGGARLLRLEGGCGWRDDGLGWWGLWFQVVLNEGVVGEGAGRFCGFLLRLDFGLLGLGWTRWLCEGV
jgi:hypothetical protein